jgi:hypothetical protein
MMLSHSTTPTPMKKLLILLILIPYLSFTQEKTLAVSKYPRAIGDITLDPKTDKANYAACGECDIFQYFQLHEATYDGDKLAIEKIFLETYNSKNVKQESGLIRIRFIVNCLGETERFRLIASDENYQEKTFDESITSQLLEITKNLKGWKAMTYNNAKVNYYQYLIFKIKDGQIQEIL